MSVYSSSNDSGEGWSLSADDNMSIANNTFSGNLTSVDGCNWYDPYPNYRWYPYPSTTIIERCKYCEGRACSTPEMCPRVKKIEYFKDGGISKIEFHKT